MACFAHTSRRIVRLSTQTAFSTSRSFAKSAIHAKQTYPLYPSVAHLLHEKGVPSSEADKIPASGPKGRLLKGDVLAYLGTIPASYASDLSKRISNLSHLDLSNIQLAAPPELKKKAVTPAPQIPRREPDAVIAVSISFKAVLDIQRRIQETLGITLPLSEFIARATEIANDDLPRPANNKLSADELYNQVLGLDKLNSQVSRGNYLPQVEALPLAAGATSLPAVGPVKELDIFDILAGNPSPAKTFEAPVTPHIGGEADTVISVLAPGGEEKRARVFLERVKSILQVEPGRLVL
ncbi:pyridoxine biosynthesis protein [Peltigera leucophlebia]|nr:pyridoxine biosynthesis protein [Peltigera leucophlebia]